MILSFFVIQFRNEEINKIVQVNLTNTELSEKFIGFKYECAFSKFIIANNSSKSFD